MISLRHFLPFDLPALRNFPDYAALEDQAILTMIRQWNAGTYEGKYFEMFAVTDSEAVVGSVSLYQRAAHLISLGPDILPEKRNQGYGFAAMATALRVAKARGYTLAVQQVRTDNVPSVALHEKLGFERTGEVYRNRKGREIFLYLRAL